MKVSTRTRRMLRRVERELHKDWLYHDWEQEAVDVIRDLAKALRKTIGPDPKKKGKR